LEGTDAADLGGLFEGPSAVAFVDTDPVAAAKSVTAAAKKFPTLVLKGGFVEGRVLDADQTKALADLDSREVMLSKLAGMMKSEIARAAAAFQATQARFLSLLEAFKAKVPGGDEGQPEASEEPEATEEPATEEAPATEEPTASEEASPPEDTAEAPAAEAAEASADEETSDADAAASDGEE
jgi:large subunit ribosomal protein L10